MEEFNEEVSSSEKSRIRIGRSTLKERSKRRITIGMMGLLPSDPLGAGSHFLCAVMVSHSAGTRAEIRSTQRGTFSGVTC